ncbi:MAG: hypothetical protein K2M31_05225 [Muribaculaceae bacterium]|nr:hypothetical protein [Muribaculaceae bacterium]
MKRYILIASMLMAGVAPMLAEIEDDIYYDPRKVAHNSNQAKQSSSGHQSNYISNFQDMDVDDYNMRGQYYVTPVDTIGSGIGNAEDFVYTTQIQKFYNPTVVIDNKETLADILENSYGNVTIEYNFAGLPTFGRWFAGFYDNLFYPYYGYYNGPYWAWNIGPISVGWNWGWNNPWNWGWNNPWSWGWGPSWSWGWTPSYYPGHWRPVYNNYWADYRPGGNRPVGPRPGWSHDYHRPIGNMAGHTSGTRPGNNSRPSMGSIGSNMNQTNHGYGRQPGQGAYQGNQSGSLNSNRYQTNGNSSANSTRPGGYTIGGDGHRRYGNTGSQSGTTNQGGYRTQSSGSTSSGSYRQNGNSSSYGRQSGSGAYNSGSSNRNSGSSYNSNRNSGSSYNSTRNSGSNYNSTRSSGSGYNSGSSSRSYNSGSNSGSYNTGGHRSSGGGFSGGGFSGGGGSRGGRR